MTVVKGVDPGEATGWSRWEMNAFIPMTRLELGITPGGLAGLMPKLIDGSFFKGIDVLVVEKFRLGGDTPFPDLEAMRIEGALELAAELHGVKHVVWQHRSVKRQVSDHLLRRHGLWVEPSDVDWTDGRDINDSQIHALAWAKLQDHRPTLDRYWGRD